MKKSVLLISVFAGIMAAAYGQAEFKPGFVIRNNGDSVNGLVFYSVDGKFDRECRFKRFEIAREFAYSPSELKAFGFRNGRYFESKKQGNRKAFYECLLKGPVSVYIKSGKASGPVFIESQSSGFFRLEKGSNRIATGTFPNYTETLHHILEKTGIPGAEISPDGFSAQAIVTALRQGGRAFTVQPKAFYASPPVRYIGDYSMTGRSSLLTIGVNAGYQFLILGIEGSRNSDYFNSADYHFSYRPVAGLYLNQRFSRKSDRASVDVSVNYLEDHYYGYSEYHEGALVRRTDLLFSQKSIQVPVSFRLTLGEHKVRPYLKAGVFKTFLIDHSYQRVSEEQFQDEVYINEFSDFDYNGEVGVSGGAGLNFDLGTTRHLGIEAIYMMGRQRLRPTTTNPLSSMLKTNCIGIMFHVNL